MSHYLNQCWPSSLMHIYVARGRWVNLMTHIHLNHILCIIFPIWFIPIWITHPTRCLQLCTDPAYHYATVGHNSEESSAMYHMWWRSGICYAFPLVPFVRYIAICHTMHARYELATWHLWPVMACTMLCTCEWIGEWMVGLHKKEGSMILWRYHSSLN